MFLFLFAICSGIAFNVDNDGVYIVDNDNKYNANNGICEHNANWQHICNGYANEK